MIPKLGRPFEPILEHFRCKLGISEDEYMEVPPCDSTICSASEIEDRELTMNKPIPCMIFMNILVETIDDFFQDMTKVQYGVKAVINVLDGDSCDDPRLQELSAGPEIADCRYRPKIA